MMTAVQAYAKLARRRRGKLRIPSQAFLRRLDRMSKEADRLLDLAERELREVRPLGRLEADRAGCLKVVSVRKPRTTKRKG